MPVIILNNTNPRIVARFDRELGSKMPPLSEPPFGPPQSACNCLTGTAYIDGDGTCRCAPLPGPGIYPAPIRTGPGVPIRWWPGAYPFQPQPQPAPAPAPTPAPVNPNHEEEDLWFGFEPWKVIVAAAAAGTGVYLLSQQGAPK